MDTLIHLKEVTSTSDVLMQLLNTKSDEIQEGTLVYADYQLKGRGQARNVWESEDGKNLTFSMVLFPDFIRPDQQFLISQVTSLAVADFLTNYCGLTDVSVKWPNDVYWREKKICGMLIEMSLIGRNIDYAILGVGINLNQELFLSDAPNPVSVKLITGKDTNIDYSAERIRQCVMSRYMTMASGDYDKIRKDYFSRLLWGNGLHPFIDATGPFKAEIVDVKDAGQLILKKEDGSICSYLHKEVEFCIAK